MKGGMVRKREVQEKYLLKKWKDDSPVENRETNIRVNWEWQCKLAVLISVKG